MSTPGDWYASLPPITRIFGTACVATRLLAQFQILSAFELFNLDFGLIFNKFHVWRLLTPSVVIPGPGMYFVSRVIMIIQYGFPLERVTFEHRTADFAFLLLLGQAALLPLAYCFGFRFTAPPLVFMLVYVWSRYNRTSSVSMYGVVSLQAFYVPWAILFIDILLGYDPLGDLCGVLTGHLYYHLVELYPRAGGKQLLSTPEWLKFALASAGVGHADPAYAQRANPGHKAWQGTGRRLGGR